jgi:hydrogenase/urease accessory protein HupE
MGWIGILVAMLIVFGGDATRAHESRPLYVEIIEKAPNAFAVAWKIPPSARSVISPIVVMPQICAASTPAAGTRLIKRQLFRCKNDLSGERIRIEFPDYNPSISALFRFQRLSGEKHIAIRNPKDLAWRVPEREATASVSKEYFILGVEHILMGYDHLLFVACLVLIAGTWRRILITVTGFTIAHSITLGLAALEVVRVPVPPVEAAIALSIVFLATEIARERRDTLTWRYPIAVAGTFGLLHGFGFASVLGEIGLPQTEVPAALLFFNIGVEVGQIAFVTLLVGLVGALAAYGVIQRTGTAGEESAIPVRFARPAAYVVGPLAAYWMIERVVGFVA